MAKDLVAVGNTVALVRKRLTPARYGDLADVPPDLESLANITNPKTRRAYRIDVGPVWVGPRTVGASTRSKLSALSSLFDYLCERNAVSGNPADGVKRPMANGNEGSTPALGDGQARKLLEVLPADTLKGVRDRAILATLLYHGMRREELCGLRVRDMQSRQGVVHFRVRGKRGKIGSFRSMRWRSGRSRNIWPSPATTARMPRVPSFAR